MRHPLQHNVNLPHLETPPTMLREDTPRMSDEPRHICECNCVSQDLQGDSLGTVIIVSLLLRIEKATGIITASSPYLKNVVVG
jgi:hypothetical protein